MRRAAMQALLAHWWRHPVQLITLLGGLALATALWSGVQAINAEARASYDAAAGVLGEGQHDQLLSADGQPMAQTVWLALRRAGWLVSPVVEGRLGDVRLVGIEPLTAPGGLGPVAPVDGADLAAFITTGQIFGRAEVLAALPATGAALVAAPDAAPGVAVTDIGLAQRLLGLEGRVTRLVLNQVQPAGLPPLEQVAPGLQRRAAQGADIGRLTDSFHLNLAAFGLLAFAVGIFIVHGAIGLAFEQRRPMLRTLRALGLPLRSLVGLMLAELLVVALLAGALGMALGWVIAAALLPDVAATLRGLYGAEVSGSLALRPIWWISGLAMAVLGALGAGGGALLRLSRLSPLATALAGPGGLSRWLGAGSLAALALAGGAALVGQAGEAQGLTAGFVLLGGLLIGGALALPLLLSALLTLGGRLARGPEAQWFWADARAGLPALSLALMALLLAMAANIGVATMVGSFRLTFTGFLDQRLASELYVQARDEAEAARIAAWLAPRVDAVLPLMTVERPVAGQPAEIYAARDHATYRQNWRLLQAVPQVWDRLAQGEGVLVNEQLHRRAGLRLGDRVTVGEGRELPVLGIYGDYGNPIGQVIVTEAVFAALYPQVRPLRFGLRLAPDRVPALRAALTTDTGLPAAQIIDQAAIKAFSLEVFERTFLVTGALNVLTLAVAGFALLMSLLTLSAMRLPQLAPLWAMGLTRRRLAALDLARVLVLAALTALCALPLGLALAWVLLSVVNPAAFGWRLPVVLFPADWAALGLATLLAAALAGLWPALRLARLTPAALIAVFADDR